jgi:hypothetical protein
MKKITGMHLAQTHLPKLGWLDKATPKIRFDGTLQPSYTAYNGYRSRVVAVESQWLGYDLWFDITLRKPGKKVIK